MTRELAKNYLIVLRNFFMQILKNDRIAQHEVSQVFDDLLQLIEPKQPD